MEHLLIDEGVSISTEDRVARLRDEIKKCDKCKNLRHDKHKSSKWKPWLFPEEDGVKGFLGCSDIMFVGERPSTGKSKDDKLDEATKLFYNLLKKYGFQEAHLTDLTKCRKEVKEEDTLQEISNCLGYFKRELTDINTRTLVALGQKQYMTLKFLLPALEQPVELLRLRHYSATIRFKDKKKRREAKEKYYHEFKELSLKLRKRNLK